MMNNWNRDAGSPAVLATPLRTPNALMLIQCHGVGFTHRLAKLNIFNDSPSSDSSIIESLTGPSGASNPGIGQVLDLYRGSASGEVKCRCQARRRCDDMHRKFFKFSTRISIEYEDRCPMQGAREQLVCILS